ncbi:MAG: hypothetical protein ABSF16_10590 [Terracidiphilus sp.]
MDITVRDISITESSWAWGHGPTGAMDTAGAVIDSPAVGAEAIAAAGARVAAVVMHAVAAEHVAVEQHAAAVEHGAAHRMHQLHMAAAVDHTAAAEQHMPAVVVERTAAAVVEDGANG